MEPFEGGTFFFGMGPFKGGHYYLHHLHHTLASSQTTGREHNPALQQKTGLEIY